MSSCKSLQSQYIQSIQDCDKIRCLPARGRLTSLPKLQMYEQVKPCVQVISTMPVNLEGDTSARCHDANWQPYFICEETNGVIITHLQSTAVRNCYIDLSCIDHVIFSTSSNLERLLWHWCGMRQSIFCQTCEWSFRCSDAEIILY